MLNERWHKRILRAKKTDGKVKLNTEILEASMKELEWANPSTQTSMLKWKDRMRVKNHVKLMEYLQKDNDSGHAHNMDMLVSSLNMNQHLRESVLDAEVTEDEEKNMYVISFPFGTKTIEYKLNKKAVDGTE